MHSWTPSPLRSLSGLYPETQQCLSEMHLEEAADTATRFTSNSVEAGSRFNKEYNPAQNGGPRQTQQGYQYRQYPKGLQVKKESGRDYYG